MVCLGKHLQYYPPPRYEVIRFTPLRKHMVELCLIECHFPLPYLWILRCVRLMLLNTRFRSLGTVVNIVIRARDDQSGVRIMEGWFFFFSKPPDWFWGPTSSVATGDKPAGAWSYFHLVPRIRLKGTITCIFLLCLDGVNRVRFTLLSLGFGHLLAVFFTVAALLIVNCGVLVLC